MRGKAEFAATAFWFFPPVERLGFFRLKTHQHIHLPDDPVKVPKWLYLDLEFVRSGSKVISFGICEEEKRLLERAIQLLQNMPFCIAIRFIIAVMMTFPAPLTVRLRIV